MEFEDQVIFVDVGVPFKRISEAVDIQRFRDKEVHLFITHEHTDHVAGIKPFINKFAPKIYSSEGTAIAMEKHLGDTSSFLVLEAGGDYDISGFSSIPFAIAHDSNEPFGFRFTFDDKVVSFATDLGIVTNEVEDFLRCSDLLILESNYEPQLLTESKYPVYLKNRIASHKGHLSNKDAFRLMGSICDTGIGRAFLAHVSDENNDYDILEKYAKACMKSYDVQTEVLRRDTPLTDIKL
jgi:phosphoribosyl 1,2-cyclic phosphodiesterase